MAHLSFNRTRAALNWSRWCEQEVLLDQVELVPRNILIPEFVRYGLMPLLKKHKYKLACSEHRLGECIARILYYKKIRHNPINIDHKGEDYDHYYYVLDDEVWEKFWLCWGRWCDVEDTNVQELIRFCLWTLLDIDGSEQTDVVDDMLGLNEEEYIQSREDPYLADAAKGYFSPI